MIDPLQTLLIVVSLLFAAVAAVYVVLDRPTGGLLLGLAALLELGLLAQAVIGIGQLASGDRGRQRRGLRRLPPRHPALPAAGDAVGARRAQPRRYGGAGRGRPRGAGARSCGSSRSGRRRCLTGQRAPTTGWGRALILVYAVFAFSATRALVDPAGAEGRRGAAGLRALGVRRRRVRGGDLLPGAARPPYHPLAWAAVLVELAGVLVVGALTVVDPELFPDDTVWSRLRQRLRLGAGGAAVPRPGLAVAHPPGPSGQRKADSPVSA